MGGHYSATKARCNEIDGSILVLHDTTEIAYNRSKSEGIGSHRIYSNKRGFYSSDKEVHKCGIYMHPSLTLTTEGLPLGLANNIFWSRKNFKNSREVQKKKNYSRIPISEKESYCWIQGLESSNKLLANPEKLIHIADREADIYEFFHTAISQNSHFLVRSKSNRKTSDNEFEKIFEVMNSSKVKGNYEIKYRDNNGEDVIAKLELKFETMRIRPSDGVKKIFFLNWM